MNQHIFIWAPYQGREGERRIIDQPAIVGMKEALDLAHDNREEWRKKYGDGQVIVVRVVSYVGLH